MIIAQFYWHIFSAGFRMETSGSRKKGKRRKRCKESFYLLPLMFPATKLEGETHAQANGPAIVNTLVRIALYEPPEIRVGVDARNRQKLPGGRVDI